MGFLPSSEEALSLWMDTEACYVLSGVGQIALFTSRKSMPWDSRPSCSPFLVEGDSLLKLPRFVLITVASDFAAALDVVASSCFEQGGQDAHAEAAAIALFADAAG